MTEHHWSEPMPWQDEQQKHDRQVRRMLREAEIPVPADDDTDPTGSPMVWVAGAIVFALGAVVGAAGATFFGG
jgi:hypothetical protein